MESENRIHDVYGVNMENMITIKGELENVCVAEQLISKIERLNYGHPPLLPLLPYIVPPQYNMPVMPFLPPPPAPLLNMPTPNETIFIHVPSSMVGAIIGKDANIIREMINSSGASIKVQSKMDPSVNTQAMRKVTIIGNVEAQYKAQCMIFRKVCRSHCTYQGVRLTVEMHIPNSQVGRVIGKRGRNIEGLKQHTHTRIILGTNDFESKETAVYIFGNFHDVQAAQHAIRAIINTCSIPRYTTGLTTSH